MKIQGKIAVFVGLVALISSCQKEVLPSPGGCHSPAEQPANVRMSDPEEDNSNGSVLDDGGTEPLDSIEIVGGGDADRDGGGIVGGGDNDHDGGSRVMGGGKPRK